MLLNKENNFENMTKKIKIFENGNADFIKDDDIKSFSMKDSSCGLISTAPIGVVENEEDIPDNVKRFDEDDIISVEMISENEDTPLDDEMSRWQLIQDTEFMQKFSEDWNGSDVWNAVVEVIVDYAMKPTEFRKKLKEVLTEYDMLEDYSSLINVSVFESLEDKYYIQPGDRMTIDHKNYGRIQVKITKVDVKNNKVYFWSVKKKVMGCVGFDKIKGIKLVGERKLFEKLGFVPYNGFVQWNDVLAKVLDEDGNDGEVMISLASNGEKKIVKRSEIKELKINENFATDTNWAELSELIKKHDANIVKTENASEIKMTDEDFIEFNLEFIDNDALDAFLTEYNFTRYNKVLDVVYISTNSVTLKSKIANAINENENDKQKYDIVRFLENCNDVDKVISLAMDLREVAYENMISLEETDKFLEEHNFSFSIGADNKTRLEYNKKYIEMLLDILQNCDLKFNANI